MHLGALHTRLGSRTPRHVLDNATLRCVHSHGQSILASSRRAGEGPNKYHMCSGTVASHVLRAIYRIW